MPGYTPDGWMVRIFTESGIVDGDRPVRDFSPEMRNDFLDRALVVPTVAGLGAEFFDLDAR